MDKNQIPSTKAPILNVMAVKDPMGFRFMFTPPIDTQL